MPYTTVVPSTTITAAWGNANVRDQVITPFANTAARTTAVTSAVEGMLSYLADVPKRFEYFNGTLWTPMPGATPIALQTLGSNVNSVPLASIPQTFRHLQLIVDGTGTNASFTVDLGLQFNSDNGTSYAFNSMVNNTGSVVAASQSGQSNAMIGILTGSTANARHAGGNVITIPNYTSGVAKSIMGMGMAGDGGAIFVSTFRHGHWGGPGGTPAAITSVTVLPLSGQLATGTFIGLYGVA